MKRLATIVTLTLSTTAFAGGVHTQEHDHKHSGNESKIGYKIAANNVNSVVFIDANDSMRFETDQNLSFKKGDIVKFVVKNTGKIRHEFSLGTVEDHKSHRVMMRNMPGMNHTDDMTLTLDPNESKELTWKFNSPATIQIACNIPGHFEAGMKRNIIVK